MRTVHRHSKAIESADWETRAVYHEAEIGDWARAYIMRTGIEGDAGLDVSGYIRIGRLIVSYTYEDDYTQPHEASISWHLGHMYSGKSLRFAFSWPRRA